MNSVLPFLYGTMRKWKCSVPGVSIVSYNELLIVILLWSDCYVYFHINCAAHYPNIYIYWCLDGTAYWCNAGHWFDPVELCKLMVSETYILPSFIGKQMQKLERKIQGEERDEKWGDIYMKMCPSLLGWTFGWISPPHTEASLNVHTECSL